MKLHRAAAQAGAASLPGQISLLVLFCHPRKREHTQVIIWERQMWSLTLWLHKRLFSPQPEGSYPPTQFSLTFKSEVLVGKYLIWTIFWHWTVHEEEYFLPTAEKLLDHPCLSTSSLKTGFSSTESNRGPYISLHFFNKLKIIMCWVFSLNDYQGYNCVGFS